MALLTQNQGSYTMTVFDPDYKSPQKEPLSSTKFWRRFSEMRVEGYSRHIHFFEPKLGEFETEITQFTDPSEEAWKKSVEAELARERAQLDLFKSYRMIYGELSAKLREYDDRRKEEDESFNKMKHELKVLQEECRKLTKKLREEKMHLGGKLNRLENMIMSSSEGTNEKANKVLKIACSYEKMRKERDTRSTDVEQKSDAVLKKYQEIEKEKTNAIFNKWKDTISSLDKSLREFRKSVHLNKGGLVKATEVEIDTIVEVGKTNRQKTTKIQSFQRVVDLLQANEICWNYLGVEEVNDLRQEQNKTPHSPEQEQDEPIKETREAETEISELHIEDQTKNSKEQNDKEIENNEKETPTEQETIVKPFHDEDDYTERPLKPIKQSWCEKDHENAIEEISLKDCKEAKARARPRPLPLPPKRTSNGNRTSQTTNARSNDEDTNLANILPGSTKLSCGSARQLTESTDVSQESFNTKIRSGEASRRSDNKVTQSEAPRSARVPHKSHEESQEVHSVSIKSTQQNAITDSQQLPRFNPYSVKIKKSFKKEMDGQMGVKKGEKVKIIGRVEANGFVMATKKTKLAKKKSGLIPAYSFDAPS